jgi:hypothetical protein
MDDKPAAHGTVSVEERYTLHQWPIERGSIPTSLCIRSYADGTICLAIEEDWEDYLDD